jgi:hypothetical protein
MMEALRTWTIEGATPFVVTLYKPAMTIRCGDGPESELTPKQVTLLSERLLNVEEYFDTEDPEGL